MLRVSFDRWQCAVVCGRFADVSCCQLSARSAEFLRLANRRRAEKIGRTEEHRSLRQWWFDAAGRLHRARSLGASQRRRKASAPEVGFAACNTCTLTIRNQRLE